MSAKDNRKLMFEEVDKRTYRKPTESELTEALIAERRRIDVEEEIERLKIELRKLSNHKSTVFYDSPGLPYDVRNYIASGRTELI